MWVWIARLLSFVGSWRKLFLWFLPVVAVITRIIGWVGRIWASARNTLLGRLLRMAGLMSVAGAVSVLMTKALFSIVGELVKVGYTLGFEWPSNPLLHSVFGAANTLIEISVLFQLLIYWVYLSFFLLAIRLGKYMISLTAG